MTSTMTSRLTWKFIWTITISTISIMNSLFITSSIILISSVLALLLSLPSFLKPETLVN